MMIFVAFLLIVVVAGYIVYPLFKKKPNQPIYTKRQIQRIEEEIEEEILALRKYAGRS